MKTNKSKNRYQFDFQINIPEPESKRPGGTFWGIFGTLFALAGVFAWVYLFSLDRQDSGKILLVAGIVNGILLAANVAAICRIGYDGFLKNAVVTWGTGVILMVVGFYLAQIHILMIPESGGLLWGILDFLLLAAAAILLEALPTMAICAAMWAVMRIFGS